MKKASTLNKIAVKSPNTVWTVGKNNCHFTSLLEALNIGRENDTFIVYEGIYYGKFPIRHGQSFNFIGDVTLAQNEDDYLLQFIPSESYSTNESNFIDEFVHFSASFSGSIPRFSPYNYTKWVQPGNLNSPYPSFDGFCNLRNLFIYRHFRVYQSGSNPPQLDETNFFPEVEPSVMTNIINGYPDTNPQRVSAGVFRIDFFPDMFVSYKRIARVNIINPDEYSIITYGRGSNHNTLDLYVKDYSGNLKDGFDISVFAESPLGFYFPA